VTKTISYTYNLGGLAETITYPSGRVITYTYSAIGRPLTAKDLGNSINYVTDALYAPHGALSSLKNGVTGTFAGITTMNSYNSRLQVALLSAAAPSATVFSLSYGYGTSNNNQIASIVNNLNNARTQSFTYDTLRRLATGQSQATSGPECWGQSFGYDRWANFLTATVTKCSAPSQSLTVSTATNRITNTGFAYDNAGDLTNENGPAYTWNAEEQITAAAGVNYTYDGDALRVKKSDGKLYWRSIAISVLAESDASGNTTVEYVYFAGKRVGARDAAGNVFYLFEDHRSGTVLATDATGTPCFDADYFAFGADNLKVNTCPQAYRYATYERDPETGLDYAIFRYYNSRLGRFMSADLLAGGVGDPQSLNRYAYVLNDPVNHTDPLGLDGTCDSSGNCTVDVWERRNGDGEEPRAANDAFGNGPGRSGGCSISIGLLRLNFVACPTGAQLRRLFREIRDAAKRTKEAIPYDKACPGPSGVVSFSVGGNLLAGANLNITLGINSTGITISTTWIDGAAGIPQITFGAGVGYQEIGETVASVDLNFFKKSGNQVLQSRVGLTVPLNSAEVPVGILATTGVGAHLFKPPVTAQWNGATNTQNYCWAF